MKKRFRLSILLTIVFSLLVQLIYIPAVPSLDNMMWDRKLIKALFDFDYKWEIYTPAEQRKYGYYVLPLLSGERFIGRVELICDRKADTLIVKNLWLEDGIKAGAKLMKDVQRCYSRFQRFHGLKNINLSEIEV